MTITRAARRRIEESKTGRGKRDIVSDIAKHR